MTPANRSKGRVLKFVCVLDDTVRCVQDLGYVKDGEETGQRQAIKRMLAKRAVINGQRVQVFLLKEPPSEEFSMADPLDESLRTQDGRWQLPSDAWLAVRAAKVAENKRRAEEAGQVALQMATNNLAVELGSLMKHATAATTPTGGKGAR